MERMQRQRSLALVFSLAGAWASGRDASGQAFLPQVKVKAPVPQMNAFFGYAIAADGDTLVVGSYNEGSVVGSQAGAARIYRAAGPAQWDFVWKLKHVTGQIWSGVTVAIEGDWIAVGSVGGGIGVYRRTGGLVQTVFPAPRPCCRTETYATPVALSGDWLFVGDPMLEAPPLLDGPGHVSVFQRQLDDTWILFDDLEGVGNMALGYGLAAEGDLLAASAGGGSGVVWLYERNRGGPDNWGFVTAVSSVPSYPISLDLDGDARLLVGNWNSTTRGATLFERDVNEPSNWPVAATFPALRPGDASGFGVALDGDLAFVGSPALYSSTIEGRVAVYSRASGAWQPAGLLEAEDGAPGNGFGTSVSATRSTLFVGAWKDGEVQPASGATYVIPWKAPRSVSGAPRGGGTWPF
jgi:hypothetical protein